MILPDPPKIALTCAGESRLPRSPERYLAAVALAGGQGAFVGPPSDPREVAAQYDGFIIPGGPDIHPARYGQTPLFPLDLEDGKRTGFELSLLHEIIILNKPVLGICYGMQVMNVFFGGTLYQDIGSQVRDALDHRSGIHTIRTSACRFAADGVFEVNSSHHQAIQRPGEGLRVCAESEDGIVESVEGDACRYLVGVQWHPERHDAPVSKEVFRTFVEACRGR